MKAITTRAKAQIKNDKEIKAQIKKASAVRILADAFYFLLGGTW